MNLKESSLHPHLLSKTVIGSENAEPDVDGHVASQGEELCYDLPKFLDETRFQIPYDILVPYVAILAQGDEESSSSNQNNCADELG